MEREVDVEILQDILEKTFARKQFRSRQLEIIRSVLNRKDVLVVLPTGHGKSLTFQLPAVVQNCVGSAGDGQDSGGFYVVVSPLLALMKDQVRQLKALGVAAESINSTTSAEERRIILRQFTDGRGCLLYVSPEQCFTPGFNAFLGALGPERVKRIVVDEAHCAIEWGSDFRKDYARLGQEFRKVLGPNVPFMALTGTASPNMKDQIVKNLGLKDLHVYQGSTRRPHLHYEVRYVEDAGDRLLDLLKFLKMYRGRLAMLATPSRTELAYPGCGIIYCRSRASTELIAHECNRELGQCAAAYHAGMSARDRDSILEKWVNGDPKCSVVVATVAFGLGIDKPDSRFVIHFDLPQNMEAYIQQTGRAGRDRKAARCILYYSMDESQRCRRFVKDKSSTESTVALLKYATTINRCRHRLLSEYFGGVDKQEKCEYACDFCKMPKRLRYRFDEWYSQVS